MREWTEKTLQKYCRRILGRDVRVVFKTFEELGHDALVHPRSQTLFYSDRFLPRWVIYHECGHLALNPPESSLEPSDFHGAVDYSPRHSRHEPDLTGVTFDRHVQNERAAHLWAIHKAMKSGSRKLLKELVDAVDVHWDEVPVYREARKLLEQDLKKLSLR